MVGTIPNIDAIPYRGIPGGGVPATDSGVPDRIEGYPGWLWPHGWDEM